MKKIGREFEKNSFMLFVLMMSANVCNYLFQIIMGNLMEVEPVSYTHLDVYKRQR